MDFVSFAHLAFRYQPGSKLLKINYQIKQINFAMFINSFIIIQLTIPDTNNKNYITNKSGWAYLKKMSAFLSSILDDHK